MTWSLQESESQGQTPEERLRRRVAQALKDGLLNAKRRRPKCAPIKGARDWRERQPQSENDNAELQ